MHNCISNPACAEKPCVAAVGAVRRRRAQISRQQGVTCSFSNLPCTCLAEQIAGMQAATQRNEGSKASSSRPACKVEADHRAERVSPCSRTLVRRKPGWRQRRSATRRSAAGGSRRACRRRRTRTRAQSRTAIASCATWLHAPDSWTCAVPARCRRRSLPSAPLSAPVAGAVGRCV